MMQARDRAIRPTTTLEREKKMGDGVTSPTNAPVNQTTGHSGAPSPADTAAQLEFGKALKQETLPPATDWNANLPSPSANNPFTKLSGSHDQSGSHDECHRTGCHKAREDLPASHPFNRHPGLSPLVVNIPDQNKERVVGALNDIWNYPLAPISLPVRAVHGVTTNLVNMAVDVGLGPLKGDPAHEELVAPVRTYGPLVLDTLALGAIGGAGRAGEAASTGLAGEELPATLAREKLPVIIEGSTEAKVVRGVEAMASRTGHEITSFELQNLKGVREATLIAHGNTNIVAIGTEQYTAKQLAKAFVDSGWEGGTIRLVTCNSGVCTALGDSFAQRFANELELLGADSGVIAPDATAGVGASGFPRVTNTSIPVNAEGNSIGLDLGKGWKYFVANTPPK
jgi:hypothetical protein